MRAKGAKGRRREGAAGRTLGGGCGIAGKVSERTTQASIRDDLGGPLIEGAQSGAEVKVPLRPRGGGGGWGARGLAVRRSSAMPVGTTASRPGQSTQYHPHRRSYQQQRPRQRQRRRQCGRRAAAGRRARPLERVAGACPARPPRRHAHAAAGRRWVAPTTATIKAGGGGPGGGAGRPPERGRRPCSTPPPRHADPSGQGPLVLDGVRPPRRCCGGTGRGAPRGGRRRRGSLSEEGGVRERGVAETGWYRP